jgi:hypothetical protein
MWPTITSDHSLRQRRCRQGGTPLGMMVRRWPTPRTEDGECAGAHRGEPDSLHSAVLWPTPRARKTTSEEPEVWLKRQRAGKVATPPLGMAVRMWPTPRGSDHRSGKVSERVWKSTRRPLTEHAARFPTPKSEPSGPDYARAGRPESGADDLATHVARTAAGGQLNPRWVEWLMGVPIGWTACEPLETESYQQWLRGHGEY